MKQRLKRTGVYISIILGLMGIGFSGCSKRRLNPVYQGPLPLPAPFVNAFSYQKGVKVHGITRIGKTREFLVKRIQLGRGDPDTGSIVVDYFEPAQPGTAGVILVLPILGGKNKHADQFAAFLVKNGFSSLVVHRSNDFKKGFDFDRVDEVTRQRVIDIRRVIDWIETRPELAGRPVGILGISMGAFKSLMAAAVEPRIKAAVIMLAGGNLPLILARSQEKRIVEKRLRYMAENELDPEEFYQRMKQTITLDPLSLAPFMDARKFLLLLACFDRVIPYETGQALRQKMGGPQTHYLFSGHYTAVLYLPWAKHLSLVFFQSQLN